jgi:NAD(P)H dehydrogenase (quinone)
LSTTTTGGTPYGASHVSGAGARESQLSAEEKSLAVALGARLARTAALLDPRP